MSHRYHDNVVACVRCDQREQGCRGACACTRDGRDVLVLATAGGCPIGRHAGPGDDGPQGPDPRAIAESLAKRGRALWAELHTRALADDINADWLARFAARVPCGECRRHWLALQAADPLPVAGQFVWGWRLHNAVNRRLGKPEMTAEGAREVWERSPAIVVGM